MKKNFLMLLTMILICFVTGCGTKQSENADSIVEYSENEDGTWTCNGRTYQYKIELTGREKNAARDGYYIVLTNNPAVTYDEVSWSFFSSRLEDTLKPEETVIIEMGVNEK